MNQVKLFHSIFSGSSKMYKIYSHYVSYEVPFSCC